MRRRHNDRTVRSGRRTTVAGALTITVALAITLPALAQSPLDELLQPSPTPAVGDPQGLDSQTSEPFVTQSAAEIAASRTRFDDLSGDAALSVARREFPEVIKEPVFDAAKPADGITVERYLGPGTALVREEGTGRPLIMQSNVPLQVKDPGSGKDPADLSLQETASGDYAPEDALVPVKLDGDEPGAELKQSDAKIVVDNAADRDVRLVADRTFQPNSFKDTDSVITPVTSGFEIHQIIRSPDAPEAFFLDLEGLPHAEFEPIAASEGEPGLPPNGFEIRGVGGEVKGYVRQPLAYDAAQRPIESRLELVGDRLRLTVSHRDSDEVLYPVTADPLVEQRYSSAVGSNSTAGWDGWEYFSYIPSGAGFGFAVANCAYNCYGTYNLMAGGATYARGAKSDWRYRAPEGTYIWRADFADASHNSGQCGGYGVPCNDAVIGIARSDYLGWDNPSRVRGTNPLGNQSTNPYASPGGYSRGSAFFCAPPQGTTVGCDPFAPAADLSERNWAVYRLEAKPPNGGSTVRPPANIYQTVNQGTIFLGDRNKPDITSAAPPSRGWRNDQGATQSLSATATDRGLGVQNIILTGAATGGGAKGAACTGNVNTSPCPKSYTGAFNYTLNEGVNTLSLTARDIFDNESANQIWTERIDRTSPVTPVATGGLWNIRTREDGTDIDVQGPLDLRVAASDNSSNAARYAGIESVEIAVDGQPQPGVQRQGTCSGDNCEGLFDWTYNPVSYGPGEHTITAISRDRAGNTSELLQWKVQNVDPADSRPPTPRDAVVYSYDASAAEAEAETADTFPGGCLKPERGDESPPPNPGPFYYVYGTGKSNLAAAFSNGKAVAQNRRCGLIILMFGGNFHSNDKFRVKAQGNSGRVSTTANALALAKRFADGYAAGDPQRTMRLAMTVSNDLLRRGPGLRNDADPFQVGQSWANQVNQLMRHVRQDRFRNKLHAVGGVDLEGAYSSPAVAFDWMRGYDSVTSAPLMNAGSLDGCPPSGNCTVPSNCNCSDPDNPSQPLIYNWSQEKYSEIARGVYGSVFFVPQIYRKLLARQWQQLSLYNAKKHDRKAIPFTAPLSEGGLGGVGFDSRQAYGALVRQLFRNPATAYQPPFNERIVASKGM